MPKTIYIIELDSYVIYFGRSQGGCYLKDAINWKRERIWRKDAYLSECRGSRACSSTSCSTVSRAVPTCIKKVDKINQTETNKKKVPFHIRTMTRMLQENINDSMRLISSICSNSYKSTFGMSQDVISASVTTHVPIMYGSNAQIRIVITWQRRDHEEYLCFNTQRFKFLLWYSTEKNEI